MRILLVDNYDSFTYNLVHYLDRLGARVDVLRNDDPELLTDSIHDYMGIVLSPGPGLPEHSGNLMAFLQQVYGKVPILGVCLGMQALAVHCGAVLYNRTGVMHGRSVELVPEHTNSMLLKGIKDLRVGLYHSWAVKQETLSNDWVVCASALEDSAPMIMENEGKLAYAVQFHPESILTPSGLSMIENWMQSI